MDYVLKLQGHTSMSNLIGMPLLYLVVLAWWFNVLSLSCWFWCTTASALFHHENATKLHNMWV